MKTQLATPDNARENARLEYELTYCEIERERDPYLDMRTRVARTAGLDSSLNHQWEYRQMRMDYLLDELFSRMGQLAVGEGHGKS